MDGEIDPLELIGRKSDNIECGPYISDGLPFYG